MTDSRTETFKLSAPIAIHGGATDKVVFKEPRFADYMTFGDPYIFQEGAVVPIPAVIEQYLQRLIVEPKDYLAFSGQADLAVAMEARNWLIGFFLRGGKPKTEPLPTSSSDADSIPPA